MPVNQTTKDFVSISEIRDNVLILKSGSLRAIIRVNSMNFELKSNDEQIAIIQAFQRLINSIDFPLQIVVSSRKLDIGPYLKSLDTLVESQKNELLKIQAIEYSRFVKGLTELANIMSKNFYIAIPFYVIEASATTKGGLLGSAKSIIHPGEFIKKLTPEQFENYKIQLEQRIEIIVNGITGLGLESRILTKDELTNLFYNYFNPGQHLINN